MFSDSPVPSHHSFDQPQSVTVSSLVIAPDTLMVNPVTPDSAGGMNDRFF